jgi:hypothetical protein
MKQREYVEGPEALKNFEQGMIALFKVPKAAIVPAKKRGKSASSEDKSKKPDRD